MLTMDTTDVTDVSIPRIAGPEKIRLRVWRRLDWSYFLMMSKIDNRQGRNQI